MITEDDWGMTATAGLNLHLSDNRTHLRPVCPLSLYPNVWTHIWTDASDKLAWELAVNHLYVYHHSIRF